MDKNMKKRVIAVGASACLLCSSGAFAVEPNQNTDPTVPAAVAAAVDNTGSQSQNAAASKTVYVTTDLNVHEQPDASSKVLGTLKKNTAVTVTAEKYGWYTITFSGQTAYISAKYTTDTNPSQPTPTPTPSQTTTVYTTANLNVRAQPNSSAKILGSLAKGSKVETYSLKNGWYEIKFSGQTGYISAQYTTTTAPSQPTPTPTPSETKTVYTTENLKVRAQPNTSAEVLGTLKKGTKVETYGLKDGWYEVKYNGKTGYISAKYTSDTDTPQPSPSPVQTVYTKEDLRVRAQPNTSSTILGVLKQGTAVETFGETNGWYLIKYNGQDGYISKAYTTTEKPNAPTVKFTDVSQSDWFYEPVMWAVSNNITAGVSETKFAPNQTCTRAQAVVFLWNQAGRPTVSRKNAFTDVKSSDWYYKAVQWAVSKGITGGTSKTTFSPNKTCNRAEIVTFLWNRAGKPTVSTKNPFTDVKSSDWYYKAVQWAVANGVTGGTSKTTFSPKKACTRAQIVTFLYHNQ